MSTESFHQALRGLASKTIYGAQDATLATFENDSFICIEPIEEFPGVEMIQAVYVAEKQRGKGIGRNLMMQICQLAEAEKVVLAAYARPFEVKHPRKTAEQAAINFANERKYYSHDPDGENAASMRRLLRGCGFENGICQAIPAKRSRYNLFWLFDNLHVYYPASLGILARYEFMENHRVDTERPAMRLLSLMDEDFDFVNDCTYKFRGHDAFLKISGIEDDAIYSSEVVRVTFAVGKDAELALEALKLKAERSGSCLVGVATPTPPAKKHKFDKLAFENLLLKCGFNQNCPDELLGEDCCGFSDFQLLWMPSSAGQTIQVAVEKLSPKPVAA